MTYMETVIAGWKAIVAGDDVLRATILPERGAEIRSLVHVPTGTELLFQAPWGLRPPARGRTSFLERYSGGWQELFPSANEQTEYRGRTIPLHGEVALLQWECEEADSSLRCTVRCQRTPFQLVRVMRFDGGLVLDESVTNEGNQPAHFTWGHHLVIGPPFLEPGCTVELHAGRVVTPAQIPDAAARLQPGTRTSWPHAKLRSGGTVDLREVPGPECRSHDDAYVTELAEGVAVVNGSRLRLQLTFDHTIFRWLALWQAYGAPWRPGEEALAVPATTYALGVEPWVSPLPLGDAVTAREAVELGPGEVFNTTLRVDVDEIAMRAV